MGANTKAAIVRMGLKEMEAFIKHFYPKTASHVFSESCGVADLITTCFAGRNRKCAEALIAFAQEVGGNVNFGKSVLVCIHTSIAVTSAAHLKTLDEIHKFDFL